MSGHEQSTSASVFAVTPFKPYSDGFIPRGASQGYLGGARALAFHVSRLTTLAAVLLAGSTPPVVTSPKDLSASQAEFRPASMTIALGAHFLEAYDEMASFLNLDAGWDGEESIAPSVQAISRAMNYLRALPSDVPAPEATVSADGSVGWFWRSDDVFASVEILNSSVTVFYAEDKRTGQAARGLFKGENPEIPDDLIEIIRAV